MIASTFWKIGEIAPKLLDQDKQFIFVADKGMKGFLGQAKVVLFLIVRAGLVPARIVPGLYLPALWVLVQNFGGAGAVGVGSLICYLKVLLYSIKIFNKGKTLKRGGK